MRLGNARPGAAGSQGAGTLAQARAIRGTPGEVEHGFGETPWDGLNGVHGIGHLGSGGHRRNDRQAMFGTREQRAAAR